MFDIGLADALAAILALSLNAYVLFGGADFGGGVWDLLASGPRRARQRAVIAHALGPIWEANHVWLILAIVLTFTCFPPLYARLGTLLHIPLTLMLVGIVLRGSAFTFRTYDSQHDAAQRRWGRIFASASVITPVLLGVSIGAVVSGRLAPNQTGSFAQVYIEPWCTPFAFSVGLLALVLFAFLAAVFLTLETRDPDLCEDFRRRALAAGVAVFFASASGPPAVARPRAAGDGGTARVRLGRSAPPRHGRSRYRRPGRAMVPPISPGSYGGRPSGLADFLGLASGAVSPARCHRI